MSGGEPPVLRVRKDAERDLTYHYDRQKRVALRRQPPLKHRPRGFRRLLRGGRLPVLLILVGVLAVVVALKLIPRDQSSARLAGYELALRAYAYQDALLASVSVTVRPKPGEVASTAVEAAVLFTAPDSGASTEVLQALGKGETIVRGRLPYTGGERRLAAEVRIGAKSVRLAAEVEKP